MKHTPVLSALASAAILCAFALPASALNCKKNTADVTQGRKDGTADARESYPKDVQQHGYAASGSDGVGGQCYRSAYNAAYDRAKRGAKGKTAAAPAPKATGTKFTRNVFSPSSGVICDTFGIAYCADGTGVSASSTETYLGADAAKRLAETMAGADTTSFVLSNRIQCRIQEKACFKGKGSSVIDPVFTKVLFP